MYILFLLLFDWCIYRLHPRLIQLNLAFVWYSSKHPRMHRWMLHFLHNFSFPLYDEMKVRYLNSQWTHKTAHCTQLGCKCLGVSIQKAIYNSSCSGRAWQWLTKQRILSLVSRDYFHFTVPLWMLVLAAVL
jgi:hypothetical protein